MRKNVIQEIIQAQSGNDETLSIFFCSNPNVTKITWQWGSRQIQPGVTQDNFYAGEIRKVNLYAFISLLT